MSKFAEKTTVTTDNSQLEIKRILQRFGADKIGFYEDSEKVTIVFECQGRLVRYILWLPRKDDRKFWFTKAQNVKRSPENAYKEWEQACRQRWRSLALSIKADLVAVDDGIMTFEQKFMNNIVLPGGMTVGEEVLPKVAESYLNNSMPQFFLLGHAG